MKPCKRIEIVIEQTVASRIGSVLDRLGVSGYTVISGASGRGDRGTRRNDDPTGTLANCYFVVACEDEDEAARVVGHEPPRHARRPPAQGRAALVH